MVSVQTHVDQTGPLLVHEHLDERVDSGSYSVFPCLVLLFWSCCFALAALPVSLLSYQICDPASCCLCPSPLEQPPCCPVNCSWPGCPPASLILLHSSDWPIDYLVFA